MKQPLERKKRLTRLQHQCLVLPGPGNPGCLQSPFLTIRVTCGKGTYIRTLAVDIARAVGTYAHLTELERVAVGGECLAEDALREKDLGDFDSIVGSFKRVQEEVGT
eukprot:GHVU01145141.1.p1 GENE.GHVU01145141.1~~GHVU01145141.1.p1  ORF type:complete len:107 (+),score=6.09 GHVU01145141.1:308-628(+)